jgi:hypothetical protein
MDYNDIMTGTVNMTSGKELFNLSFLPVQTIKPTDQFANDLANLFISNLNDKIKNTVSDYVNINSGWQAMGKSPSAENGFEKQMEYLGLPGSLYNESIGKTKVYLVKILDTEQFTTETQARITITLVAQKEHVDDQIMLKINFFLEREKLPTGYGDYNDIKN